MWGSLPKAARCSHFTSGLAPSFFFHAAVYAADTANSLPTKANVLGRREAPDQALGLNCDLGVLVPFGTYGHHLDGGSKRDAKNELVAILGLSHDGPGYRAIKVSDGEVITSAHIKAQPALGTARSLIARVATDPTAPEAAFVSKYCNTSDIYVDIADAERGLLAHMEDTARDMAAAAAAPPPLVQQVGHAPGHGGSRCGLRRRATPAVPRGGSRRGSPQARLPATRGPIHDKATTRALVRDARAAGMVLRWRPGFTKGGISGERYPFYSRARTFAQFDALTKETFVSGLTGGTRPKATP